MLSIIRLFLGIMENIAPILWTTVLVFTLNIICMTIMHTITTTGATTRILNCFRRVSLFMFSHAIMKATMSDTDGTVDATDPKDRLLVVIKGLTVIAALTLIPKNISDEDDGEQFTSQIVYAFSTNVTGILTPLHESRVFIFISFVVILLSPYARTAVLTTTHNTKIIGPMWDVVNLVFFDAFSAVAFISSGDRFCDLAIILGVFSLLWNFHGASADLQGIQQFTTWRTATFISTIFTEIYLTGFTLATLIFVVVSILGHTHSITKMIPWLIDLLVLVGLNGAINDVVSFVNSIGDRMGIPVLLGFVIIIATINSTLSQMQPKASK
jgi:hypothetical protein